MGDRELNALLGLKAEVKMLRQKVRSLTAANDRWSGVAQTMRKLAGVDEATFGNLLKQENLD